MFQHWSDSLTAYPPRSKTNIVQWQLDCAGKEISCGVRPIVGYTFRRIAGFAVPYFVLLQKRFLAFTDFIIYLTFILQPAVYSLSWRSAPKQPTGPCLVLFRLPIYPDFWSSTAGWNPSWLYVRLHPAETVTADIEHIGVRQKFTGLTDQRVQICNKEAGSRSFDGSTISSFWHQKRQNLWEQHFSRRTDGRRTSN